MKSIALVSLLALSACAAQSKNAPAASPADAPAAAGASAQGYPQAIAPEGTASTPADAKPLSPHAAAVQGASNEIDSSQRELDVAAGDCRNACRALGSMDRAAGRLCGLTQGQPDATRCDDAKLHVYTARDRVKKTCGQCDGGPSVDHDAPIPSLR
jgi:hypothetical protein